MSQDFAVKYTESGIDQMKKNRKNPFYQIDYIRIVGCKHNPGVLLHKLHSWFLVMQHKRADGIFYKSNRELTEETGLTSHNIRTAIKFLVENQFIEIKVKGVPPTHWYKINNTKINELLKNQTQVIESRQFADSANQFADSANPYQHIPNYSSLQELKESELLRNSPDSQNPPAEDQNPGAETQSASNINITGLAAMPITLSSLDDLISSLASQTTTDESPKKKRKVIRQRKPKEQRMIEAKRAPEEFNQDEKQFYEEGWVVHLSKRGCSAVQLEEHKTLWLKFKQEHFNIVLMMRYYIAEGVYGVSEQRVRWDIEKGKHKVIPSQSTPASNVVPISKKPQVSKIPRGYVIAN